MTRCSGSIKALRLYYGSITALLRLYKCAGGDLLLATAKAAVGSHKALVGSEGSNKDLVRLGSPDLIRALLEP
jgi:hypothetical protein